MAPDLSASPDCGVISMDIAEVAHGDFDHVLQ